jgi:hypothetical protein
LRLLIDDDTVVSGGKRRNALMACRSHTWRTMSPLSITRRVAILEEQVNALNELPARVGAVEMQLVAVGGDLAALRQDFESFRVEVRGEFANVRAEAAAMEERLLDEIRTGDEETRRQMRVLHEEVISRIALLQEGLHRDRGPHLHS